MSGIVDHFTVGHLYSNEEIFTSFGVANAGGLRFRMVDGSVTRAVLMTSVPSARKARENPYHDRIENDTLTYTAAGREGDQTLAGMNKRLPTQLDIDFPIHGLRSNPGDEVLPRRRHRPERLHWRGGVGAG